MPTLLNLGQFGKNLQKIDKQIIFLLSKRMQICRKIAEYKQKNNKPILRPKIEKQRLEQVRAWARQQNINPDFAAAVFYFVIREACAVQIQEIQK